MTGSDHAWNVGQAEPIEVHIGGCYAIGKQRRAISRDDALRALADGVQACEHCRPDTELGVP
ncbi:DUF6233 domain-containing protein [Streptomyces sp. NPDC057575]|uniref:DUF6233 domain-containing protein n=1 Tax=unclassified Streptomyces TaxID=2593676 RepID=UPI00368EC07B